MALILRTTKAFQPQSDQQSHPGKTSCRPSRGRGALAHCHNSWRVRVCSGSPSASSVACSMIYEQKLYPERSHVLSPSYNREQVTQNGPAVSSDLSYNERGESDLMLIMSKRLKRTLYNLTRVAGSSRTSYTKISHLSRRVCVDGGGFSCPWPSELTMVQTTSEGTFSAG